MSSSDLLIKSAKFFHLQSRKTSNGNSSLSLSIKRIETVGPNFISYVSRMKIETNTRELTRLPLLLLWCRRGLLRACKNLEVDQMLDNLRTWIDGVSARAFRLGASLAGRSEATFKERLFCNDSEWRRAVAEICSMSTKPSSELGVLSSSL